MQLQKGVFRGVKNCLKALQRPRHAQSHNVAVLVFAVVRAAEKMRNVLAVEHCIMSGARENISSQVVGIT